MKCKRLMKKMKSLKGHDVGALYTLVLASVIPPFGSMGDASFPCQENAIMEGVNKFDSSGIRQDFSRLVVCP